MLLWFDPEYSGCRDPETFCPLQPSGMLQAAVGPQGKEAALFHGEVVEEGTSVEEVEVSRIGKCSSYLAEVCE